MIGLALLIAAAQADFFPTLPPGAHPRMIAKFQAINRDLAEGRAPASLSTLPDRDISVMVDPVGLPSERRREAMEVVQNAAEAWAKVTGGAVGRGPVDATIRFVDSPTAPHVDVKLDPSVVLTLNARRGDPRQFISLQTIYNEALRALGLSLGLDDAPSYGGAMGTTDLIVTRRVGIMARENFIARKILESVDEAKALAKRGAKPALAVPKLELEVGKVTGNVIQGDRTGRAFKVRNTGTGVLRIVAMPDCSCIRVTSEIEVPAGEERELDVQVDTTEYTGEFRHRVYVWSNAGPVSTIPVEIDIAPRWLLSPNEAPVLLVDGLAPINVDFYFAAYGNPHPKPTKAALEGFEGTVTIEEMPAPGNTFAKIPDRVWRIRATFPPGARTGRQVGNITLETDDERYTLIRRSFTIQRGIVALPSSLSFGEAAGAREAQILVGRPQKPFKVLGVESSSSHFTAVLAPGREGWDYRLIVTYDGKGTGSEVTAILTIKTDDSTQPEIKVPVSVFLPPGQGAS